MIPDRLFEAALQFKKTQLWRKLADLEIFAVRHADGEISYCCVMGMVGELTALAVYPGQAGLDSLRMLQDEIPMDDYLANFERMRGQDCAMLSLENKSFLMARDVEAAQDYCRRNGIALRGRNAFPHFERFRPGIERWYLEDEDDQRRMLDGLLAALEVSRRLTETMQTPPGIGFTDGELYDREIPLLIPDGDGWRWERHALPPRAKPVWPTAPLTDDLTRARLTRGRRSETWAAKVFRYIEPVSDEAGNDAVSFDELTRPPFFPMALMVVNAKDGMILCMHMAGGPERWAEELGGKFLETAAQGRLPKAMLVEDDRTEALFGPLCDQLGIRLERRENIEPLDEALEDFIEKFSDGPEGEPDLEDMFELFRVPGAIAQLPDEMIAQSMPLVEMGILPEDIAENLRREAKKRKLNR